VSDRSDRAVACPRDTPPRLFCFVHFAKYSFSIEAISRTLSDVVVRNVVVATLCPPVAACAVKRLFWGWARFGNYCDHDGSLTHGVAWIVEKAKLT